MQIKKQPGTHGRWVPSQAVKLTFIFYRKANDLANLPTKIQIGGAK